MAYNSLVPAGDGQRSNRETKGSVLSHHGGGHACDPFFINGEAAGDSLGDLQGEKERLREEVAYINPLTTTILLSGTHGPTRSISFWFFCLFSPS